MNGEPLRSKVTITNPQGLHMRPMQAFVELAGKFQSAVHVFKQEDQKIDGRSMWGLLSLGAEQGTELTLEVCGPDQKEALEALLAVLAWVPEEDEAGYNGPPGPAGGKAPGGAAEAPTGSP
jgi:phosphocarrier protein HPr